MLDNCTKIGPSPLYLACDPLSRMFPPGWKDIYFRRLAVREDDGTDIGYLQGDHVWPYSLFGETSWSNYQLICGNCNASKSNKLENDVRKTLGAGEFRRMVSTFLSQQIEAGSLTSDPFLGKMLGFAAQNVNNPGG